MTDSSALLARYHATLAALARAASDAGRASADVQLVAVSKTYPAEAIRVVLEAGQRVFGENYVQESMAKWPALKVDYPDAVLHMIGPLQSNKAREAVALFDCIQSVDRESLARELAKELRKELARTGRIPKLLVQVNIGEETQKAGILARDLESFLARMRDVHGLVVSGLMCIPPADLPPSPHFALLAKLADRHGLSELSMGMSSDFAEAIQLGATQVRVGSAIFGSRN